MPTIAQGGLPGFKATLWYGVLAPAGTPIAHRLHATLTKVMRAPDMKERFTAEGAEQVSSTPQGLKNGDWMYAAYLADGKTVAPDPTATCRACHLPLTKVDFVHRYDEYFVTRDGGTYRGPSGGGY